MVLTALLYSALACSVVGPLPVQTGEASWYDYQLKGYESYSQENATAASRLFKRGQHLNVCTPEKCVEVRVNDYGPEEQTKRVVDLSSFAFKQLAPLSRGVIDVQIYLIH